MADHEWLKNLASARYNKAGWAPADPAAVRRLAAARLDDTMNQLFDEAAEAVDIFNSHADSLGGAHRRSLRLLEGKASGFILMLGGVQISLERQETWLIATLSVVKGFARTLRVLHRFTPEVDPFGSLVWLMDNALLMGPELIIKRLLEDILQTAIQNGDA